MFNKLVSSVKSNSFMSEIEAGTFEFDVDEVVFDFLSEKVVRVIDVQPRGSVVFKVDSEHCNGWRHPSELAKIY